MSVRCVSVIFVTVTKYFVDFYKPVGLLFQHVYAVGLAWSAETMPVKQNTGHWISW